MSNATIGSLRVVLGLDSAQFTNGLTAAQRHLQGVGRRFQRVGEQMSGLGRSLALGLTVPIATLGATMVRAASDAEELQSAFNVSFGTMADQANRWAETTGDSLGRATSTMQQAALDFHGIFRAGGPATEQTLAMAEAFAVLAQDFSSFRNLDPAEAVQKLMSGLAGEAEPLRRFGVDLSEANVAARALAMGLADANGELSQSAKLQARAAIITEALGDAHGDVIRTSDGMANRARALQEAWTELSETVGSRLLPLFAPMVTKLTEMVNAFTQLTPQTQSFALAAAGIAAVAGPILMFVGGVASAIGALIPVLTAAGTAIAGFAAAVTSPAWAPVAAVIAAVVAAIAALVAIWQRVDDTVMPIFAEFQAKFSAAFGPRVQALMEALAPLIEGTGEAFDGFWQAAEPVLSAFGAAVESVFGEVVRRALDAFLVVATGVFDGVTDLIRIIVAVVTGDFAGAWRMAAEAVVAHLRMLWGVVEAIFPGIGNHLRRLYEQARQWLMQRLGGVFTWVSDRIDDVGDAFHNLWDRVVGHSYVPDMVEGIAAWMARLDAGMVQPALAATEATADAFADMADTVDGIFDRMLTDSQRAVRELTREMAALDRALAEGRISAAQHAQGAEFLQNEFLARDLETPTLTETTTELPGFEEIQGFFSEMNAEIAATRDAWGRAFAQGIEAAANGNLTDLLRQWVTSWARSGLEALGRSLFDRLGGGQSGGWLQTLGRMFGSGGGKLPGFANGGSFRVGGRSGIDKNLVAFRATRGEVVDVHKGDAGPWGPRDGSGQTLNFDLRGAVMTTDLLRQMEGMAARAREGGASDALEAVQRSHGRVLGQGG